MARVTGIGGFFFRAQDPDALNQWYERHFGMVPPGESYDDLGWFQDRGETVFYAFAADSEEIGPPAKTWKLNLRVDDLDGMVARLRGAGIAVAVHDTTYPNGDFAELADPEGNLIQLWQPNAESIARDPGPS